MYSTVEVCELARCSYRQLDYWLRARVLAPTVRASGSGTRRSFDAHQVAVVRLVRDLATLGATTKVMRAAAETAERIPLAAWIGTGYVDEDGCIDTEPMGTCWCVDLGACVEGLPVTVDLETSRT